MVRPHGGAGTLEESLRLASLCGQIPKASSFTVTHDEYDETMLDGYDFDIGWTRRREVSVSTVEEVEAVVSQWGFDPSELQPYHRTDAP